MKKTENNYLFWKAKRTIFFFVTNHASLSPELDILELNSDL